MENLVAEVERRWGIDRHAMATEMVFVSHETYTPARGGSAQAEVDALRRVFGRSADRVVIANTKGYTGHPMAVGIEDVLAVKALETGLIPPVPNIREIDPELGVLNLSRGGPHAVRYALRLGAGFGSQISMSRSWSACPPTDAASPEELSAYRIAARSGRLSGHQRTRARRPRWSADAAGVGCPAAHVSGSTPAAARPGRPRRRRTPVPRACHGDRGEAPRRRAANRHRRAPAEERVLAIVSEETGYAGSARLDLT
jgi:hypothetical protein